MSLALLCTEGAREDGGGSSRQVQASIVSHQQGSIDDDTGIFILQGLLICAFWCHKGAGKKTQWITKHHLYSLMHRVDDNIWSERPSKEGER